MTNFDVRMTKKRINVHKNRLIFGADLSQTLINELSSAVICEIRSREMHLKKNCGEN